MILQEHELSQEDKAQLGITLQPKESNFREDALEWIETAAYYLWIQEGYPSGKDVEHWDRAAKLYSDCRE